MAAGLCAVYGLQAALRHEGLDGVAGGHPAAGGKGTGAVPDAAGGGRVVLRVCAVSVLQAVERAAGLCPPAGHPHHRRPAHLCGHGLRRRVGRAPVLPTGRQARAQGGVRRAARLFLRRRAAVGQPAVRLGRHARRRLRLVDTAHRRRGKAVRRAAYRPFPGAGELLGRALRRHHRQERPVDQRAGHGPHRPAEGLVPADRVHRGGSGLSHAGRGPAAA